MQNNKYTMFNTVSTVLTVIFCIFTPFFSKVFLVVSNFSILHINATTYINNIIINGIKYSPKDENLIVRLYKKGYKNSKKNNQYRAYLEIENTGVTIDKKYLGEIFNPFFRIEKSRSRKTGGSGLGLYLVSQILKSHGYYHSLKNKENSVVFTIEFKN